MHLKYIIIMVVVVSIVSILNSHVCQCPFSKKSHSHSWLWSVMIHSQLWRLEKNYPSIQLFTQPRWNEKVDSEVLRLKQQKPSRQENQPSRMATVLINLYFALAPWNALDLDSLWSESLESLLGAVTGLQRRCITATFKTCRTCPPGVGQEGSYAADVGLVFGEGWLHFLLICTRPLLAVESHRKAPAISFPYSVSSCHALLNNTIVMQFGGSFQVIRAIKYSSFTLQCWGCSFFLCNLNTATYSMWQALYNHRRVWIPVVFPPSTIFNWHTCLCMYLGGLQVTSV